MKKFVSICLVTLCAVVLASSVFAAAPVEDNEEIMPLSRGNYYITEGYNTIKTVKTGFGLSSIEVYNLAENGAGIWVRIGSNSQGIHMGGSAAWTVGRGNHNIEAKIGDGPVGTYALEINVTT